MNPDPDSRHAASNGQTSGWRQAIGALVASRAEIFQIELQQALRERSRHIAAMAAAAICATFAWALTLAGGIAAVATIAGWPWHLVTLAAAAIHLLAAWLLLRLAKAPTTPPFPVTRAEFQKDREWIENLQQKPASRN